MRRVYRFEDNSEYWDRRWTEASQDAARFDNEDIYPVKYANMVVRPGCDIVEVGCGLGRLMKHYAAAGIRVVGIERSAVAVERLNREGVEVLEGDVLSMPFPDARFDTLMAFGVYHNLENGLEEALRESRRILKTGGKFCISMRPDNVEMRLNEVYWRWKSRGRANSGKRHFHKLLVNTPEFKALLLSAGLKTSEVWYARNVSILYRIPFLRDNSLQDEASRRSKGYALNRVGKLIDSALVKLFPYQTSNVIVFIGEAV